MPGVPAGPGKPSGPCVSKIIQCTYKPGMCVGSVELVRQYSLNQGFMKSVPANNGDLKLRDIKTGRR